MMLTYSDATCFARFASCCSWFCTAALYVMCMFVFVCMRFLLFYLNLFEFALYDAYVSFVLFNVLPFVAVLRSFDLCILHVMYNYNICL